jgi:hypothetical protein
MAHGGHIHHENDEFTNVGGPTPTSAFSYDPDLSSIDLDPAAYGKHTLETALSGSILEFTYVGAPIPSFTMGRGQILRPGGHRPMAQGELAQGMALTGHIRLGNHETIHTNGSTPITGLYPI